MNQIKSIFYNMSWLMVSQIITSICAFVWTILMARYLGVYEYGIFGFAVSLTGIFAILMDMGISTHIVRSIASDNKIASKYLGCAFPLKGFLGVISFLAIIAYMIIVGCDQFTIFITSIFTIEIIMKSFNSLIHGSFQAYEKGKYQAISNTILNVLTLVFILIAIYCDFGLFGIAMAYIFANLAATIYVYTMLTRHITKPKYTIDLSFSKQLLIWGFPFALSSFFYNIYYSIDMVMLSTFVGAYATGIYTATYKLINVLSLFYSIYSAVVFPVMSKFYTKERSLLKASFEKSIKYLLLVTIPCALGMVIYAGDIINFIYGNQYAMSDSVLQILIWTVCFLFVNGACSTLLNASHKEYSVTKMYVAAAIFNVVLNSILIPKYSYIGASVSTVLSEILILFISLYILNKINQIPDKHLGFDIIKIIICSSILGIVLICLHLNMWIAIPVGVIIYIILTLVFKVYDDEDKYIIKTIIGKN